MTAPTIAAIKAAVAAEYGVDAARLDGPRRTREIAWPRQTAMWLCRRLTIHGVRRIGESFGGRDHTTVSYACRAVERRLTDPDERERLERLLQALGDGADIWENAAGRAAWAAREIDRMKAEIVRLRRKVVELERERARTGPAAGEDIEIEATGAWLEMVDAPENGGRAASRDAPPVAGSSPAAPATRLRGTCSTADCPGSRQPGRDHCAGCITARARRAA